MDKSIRVYSLDGTLVRTLVGHDHGVISLDWTASGELISGSWDGTAKIWNISDGTCVHTLPGHENGVNVLALPNGSIVTASTGRQEGDTVVDFKIRIWQDGSVVKILQPHTAAVRNLSLLPDIGFASCSNDGYSANMSCCCCEFCMYDLSVLVLTHLLLAYDRWVAALPFGVKHCPHIHLPRRPPSDHATFRRWLRLQCVHTHHRRTRVRQRGHDPEGLERRAVHPDDPAPSRHVVRHCAAKRGLHHRVSRLRGAAVHTHCWESGRCRRAGNRGKPPP
jgi:hypothetical protein